MDAKCSEDFSRDVNMMLVESFDDWWEKKRRLWPHRSFWLDQIFLRNRVESSQEIPWSFPAMPSGFADPFTRPHHGTLAIFSFTLPRRRLVCNRGINRVFCRISKRVSDEVFAWVTEVGLMAACGALGEWESSACAGACLRARSRSDCCLQIEN